MSRGTAHLTGRLLHDADICGVTLYQRWPVSSQVVSKACVRLCFHKQCGERSKVKLGYKNPCRVSGLQIATVLSARRHISCSKRPSVANHQHICLGAELPPRKTVLLADRRNQRCVHKPRLKTQPGLGICAALKRHRKQCLGERRWQIRTALSCSIQFV